MRKLLAFVLCSFLVSPAAHASCGSATCPLDTRSALQRDKGFVSLGYEFEYIDQDQPRIGTHAARVGQIAGHHDEQRTLNRIHRLIGTWAPTDRLSLDIALPLVSRSHRHVHNHNGGTAIIPEGWDFSDVGDLMVQTRTIVYKAQKMSQPTLSIIAGAEFPTGKSDIVNDQGGAAEPGITPGSASYDWVIGGVSLQHFNVRTAYGQFAMLPFFVSLTYKMNGKGHEDYRIGNVLTAHTGIIYPVLSQLGLIAQLNLLVKEKDERGETNEEIEKTGGEYLYASPGVLVHLTPAWDWTTIVQLPIHQRVNQIQLTSSYTLQTSLSYRFHL
jgi:hypothetical protein